MHTITQTDESLRETCSHGTQAFPFHHYSEWYAPQKAQHLFTAWHWHTEVEFFYVESGCVTYDVGEETLHLTEGDCAFINSRVMHRGFTNGCIYHAIVFSPKLLGTPQSLVYQKYVHPVITEGISCMVFSLKEPDMPAWKEKILDCVEQICTVSQQHPAAEELKIQILVSALWMYLAEHMELVDRQEPDKNMLQQARLRKMMQYIWEHYTEHISLDEIAAAANISKSAALRCFRAEVQTSPVEYLNEYRLEHACDLLRMTMDSVSDIALKTGFESIGYFDRIFKREFGITPKQYRKQMLDMKGLQQI